MARRFLPSLFVKSAGIATSLFLFACGGAQLEPVPEDTAAKCSDGIDNDLDNSPDCFDIECAAFPNCDVTPDPEVCSGGDDEDNDGFTDCDDTDCDNDPACVQAEVCNDAQDNDGDGQVDCDDTGCAQNPQCTSNTGAGEGGGPSSNCFDSSDNDNDNAANCDDSECTDECNGANTPEICNNGIDDNFDGRIDCADPQCANQPNCAANGSEICFDGIDNDGVNGTDCSDVDCFADPFCNPGGGGGGFFEICGNGIDDDGIGGADCADIVCLLDPAAGCLPGPGDCSVDQCFNIFDPDFLNCIAFDPCCLDPNSFECTGIPPAEDCNTVGDEDLDGAADCSDTDCSALPQCTPEICDDTIDNNGNGAIDCADAGCANSASCVEICNDTIDNDNDGQVDCNDLGCANDPNCAPAEDGSCTAPFIAEVGANPSDLTGKPNLFDSVGCQDVGGADVVFQFTSAITGTATITASSATADLIIVVKDSDGADGCDGTELVCIDDQFAGTDETAQGPVDAGVPIFFVVGGFENTDQGPFTFTLSVQ